jgi:threonine synthase
LVLILTFADSNLRSSVQTVLTGLAPNGGLYIPERIPSLPSDWQEKWKSHSFIDLSVEVLSLYISEDEISRGDLRKLVEKSYSTFRHSDITPLQKINEKLFVLELFHGPTFAFKDVALQLLGNLFEFFLVRRNAKKTSGEPKEKLTVVGATSGDTGRYSRRWDMVTHLLTACSVPRFTVFETRRMFQFSFSIQKVVSLLFSRPR